MHSIRLALLLLSSVSIAVCHHKRDAYKQHLDKINYFKCSDPKPKVFELEDVVSKDILTDKYEGLRHKITPPITILHTCNSTGCCALPHERCAPAAKEEVTLTFSVIKGKSMEYFSVKAMNHTMCACRSNYHNFDNTIK